MDKALSGVRVLSFGQVGAGPTCTRILADMGAEVIKIEPLWGERLRFSPPLIQGESPHFSYNNRNKKGMTLNLKSEKGINIFKELVKHGDVVFENYSAGTMDRLGVGYDVLKEINPSIIYATITGFGYTGPNSRWRSFDIVAQAMSGLMTLTGNSAEVNRPVRVPDFLGDQIPAAYAAIAVLAALYYRKLTGKGQRIDVAQLDVMFAVVTSNAGYLATGMTREEARKKHGVTGLYDPVQAKDGYVVIAASGDMFDRLAKAIDIESPDVEAVKRWVKDKTVDEVVKRLVEARVAVAPVLTVNNVVTHPQIIAREMVTEVDHSKIGKIKMPAFPIKFSETPGRVEMPGPLLGQHNEEILSSLLGYSKEEIAKLKEEGVI